MSHVRICFDTRARLANLDIYLDDRTLNDYAEEPAEAAVDITRGQGPAMPILGRFDNEIVPHPAPVRTFWGTQYWRFTDVRYGVDCPLKFFDAKPSWQPEPAGYTKSRDESFWEIVAEESIEIHVIPYGSRCEQPRHDKDPHMRAPIDLPLPNQITTWPPAARPLITDRHSVPRQAPTSHPCTCRPEGQK